jgi:hypothetical protein
LASGTFPTRRSGGRTQFTTGDKLYEVLVDGVLITEGKLGGKRKQNESGDEDGGQPEVTGQQ